MSARPIAAIVARIDRHGLRPPEEEVTRQEVEQQGDEQRPDRIEVRDRIEGDAPQVAGGGVPLPQCLPGVGHLVNHHGEQQNGNDEQEFHERSLAVREQTRTGTRTVVSRMAEGTWGHVHPAPAFAGDAGPCTGSHP